MGAATPMSASRLRAGTDEEHDMLTTLNIGLAVEGMPDNDPQEVVIALRGTFPGALRGYRVAMSETERTFVAQLDVEDSRDGSMFTGRLYKLACLLGQDCIAVRFAGVPSGDLIGPGAVKWLPYQARYFIPYE